MPRSDSVPDADAPRKVDSGPTFEVWQLRGSSIRVDWSHANVVALTVVGYGHAAFGPPWLRRATEALRTSERLTLLIDFWDMPSYDSQLRVSMTEWALEHRSRLEPTHMLARSPIVRMGVAVANLALGGLIKAYALRANYDAAVKQLNPPAKPARRR